MALSSEIRQRIGTQEALTGHVRLGAPGIAAMTWLPALLDRAARTYPGLTVEFTVDSSEILHDMLGQGRLEVAVMARPHVAHAVTTEPLGKVQMVWLCSPSLVLPSQSMTAAELAPWPIITDRAGSHLHEAAMEWFRAEGVEPARHHGCSNLPTRIHLALIGMGVALASPLAASRELADGRLRQVTTKRPPPELEYVIAYADIGLSPAGRLIAEMAKSLIMQRPDFQSYYQPQADRLAG